MTENPYQPPLAAYETEPATTPGVRRPLGVSILAVLHLLGGLGLLAAAIWLLLNNPTPPGSPERIKVWIAAVLISSLLQTVLLLASAVGMWLGARWGWWCGAFYYVSSVMQNALSLTWVLMNAELLDQTEKGSEFYIFRHGGRLAVQLLLLLYFFKGNVLAFFGLERLGRFKTAAILFGAWLVMATVSSLLGLLMR